MLLPNQLFSLLLPLLLVGSSAGDGCLDQELTREKIDDVSSHECRSCGRIDVDAAVNCPALGFECDESLDLTARVPSAADCRCAELRCADRRAQLVVDGRATQKMLCRNETWLVPPGSPGQPPSTSAVCALPCGLGACAGRHGNPAYGPLTIAPPDNTSNCAYATCELGYAVLDDKGSLVRRVNASGMASSVTCGSDGQWKLDGGQTTAKYVGCIVPCTKLKFAYQSKCAAKVSSKGCLPATINDEHELICPAPFYPVALDMGNPAPAGEKRFDTATCIENEWVFTREGATITMAQLIAEFTTAPVFGCVLVYPF